MPTAIENALTEEQLTAFCKELRDLPGKERSFRGIQAVAKRWGITISHEAAGTFKKGPYARHLEKLNRSRETREALCSAVGAGAHPLDAMEEALVLELQDHLTESETPDVKFIVGQLLKLRQAISMREDTKRKGFESEKKIEIADVRIRDLEQKIELHQFDAAKAVLEHAKEIKLVIADTKASGKEKTERVRKILFGEKPKDFKPVTTRGEQSE
jgi:hypothetical protein